jgi:hypothetical protein
MQEMVGITLSPEQIRQAPLEVRRWLEQQIAGTLGLYRTEPAPQPPTPHLVGCNLEEARAVLSLIQGFLPVVSVFFELGREPAAVSTQGVRALWLDDMLRHAHLQAPQQIVACLQAIDEALQRVRAEPGAALTALDGGGHCLVAEATAQSIQALWREVVAAHDLVRTDAAPAFGTAPHAPEAFQSPYSISVPTVGAPPGGGSTAG